ncbi:MAG: SUMF1/EgtB/PvdO family nonheme iron enzyme, partial [Proteobacteria bacterium]|nr:SUMF1/EgtB/PvdO family nonheme iron enzyme [Pseudomonadota bacterium]
MGSDNRAADEKPQHKVYLDTYYISKYEVTNAEYYEFWKLQ